MNARPRPDSLISTCAFNRSGRALVHRWLPVEFYFVRGSSEGEPLRIGLIRCARCSAFMIRSFGGDDEALCDLLEYAHPIGETLGWVSHEQPGYAHVADRLPRRKRAKRSGYGRRRAA